MADKQIFFHVGTGKTGTTYLQYRVFPKLEGIHYIQRTSYKSVKKILPKIQTERILISREFDQQLEKEVSWFTKDFPDATPIIVFRRHDSYIASQYRRFVKNGFRGSFQDFFDLENDKGYFKQKDLNYAHQLAILEKYFTQKPIILIYEDMRENPVTFIEKLTALLGAKVEVGQLNLDRKHTSYSEKQLKFIHRVSQHINLTKRRVFENSVLHLFWKLGFSVVRYPTLFIGNIIPSSWVSQYPLIEKVELEKVKEFYNEDWEACLGRALRV